jgi:hypothetical protein
MSLILINPYAFAASALWTPADITTAFWLDASDNATVFSDAGTTQAIAGTSTVQQWNDKSGNGRNVSQATSGNRPSYLSANINGKNVVNCGSSSSMQSTATHNIGTTSVGAAVIKPNSLSAPNRDYITGGTSNSNNHILYQNAGASQLELYSGAVVNGGNVLVAGTSSIIVGRTNGLSSSVRHNGTLLATGDGGSQNWTVNINIGISSGSSYTDSIYAEVVILAGASDVSTIEKLEGYLAWKWGLEGSLPAGHPYKSAAPTT